jgi:opacity protein-like surface antigen
MKKILIISMLYSTMVLADSKVYLGLFGGVANEQFSKPKTGNIFSSAAKINLGYGDYKSYSAEIYFLYNQDNKNYFSDTSSKGGTRYSAGLNLIKAFDFGVNFYPFVKVGFGGGYLSADITIQNGNRNNLKFSSLDAGFGFNYLLVKSVVLQVCATYKHTNYQQIDPQASSGSITSNGLTTLAGLMYRF